MKDIPAEAFGFVPDSEDDPERWLCRDGRALLPREMDSNHLGHAIALIERVMARDPYPPIHPQFRHATREGAMEWLAKFREELERRISGRCCDVCMPHPCRCHDAS